MISVQNLAHSYTNNQNYAVKNINFNVHKGEIFGFLGPSGAGKSTTQNILTGLLALQTGDVNVAGYNLNHIQQDMYNHIGMSFEQSNIYHRLTAKENLDFYAKLFDVDTENSQKLLDLVGLSGKENDKAGTFSKGMKHRLTFARSMINRPKLWFLDEPTTGLDPSIANDIKYIIKDKNSQGTTVFLTTHNMYIADELCDRIAFMIEGELKIIDSPQNLKLKYGQKLVEIDYQDDTGIKHEKLSTVKNEDKIKLSNIIAHKNIIKMHTKEATLEEIFIKITGKELL